MRDVIQIENQYYILATSDRAADCTRVLKEGDTFAVFDCHGDIQPYGLGDQGLFHEGTRFLSRLEFRFAGVRPLLLGSTINKSNELLAVDLMNPDFATDTMQIRRDSIHVFRSKFIWQGNCFEQMRMTNFSLEPLQFPFTISFGADFADIFEVRGMVRENRGRLLQPEVTDSGVAIVYEGLDGAVRKMRMTFDPPPVEVSDSEALFLMKLEPKESACIKISVACECAGCRQFCGTYEMAASAARDSLKTMKSESCEVFTDNELFNSLLDRSQADLLMMMTETPFGIYPYAGVPWFSTTFGRDGIITALEIIQINPTVARGVLHYLAQTQATEFNPEQDAEPGKIIHETRLGEMAALGEIPFGRYYGSVDSTPLFVILAGVYYERTADREFIASIWGNITRALEWIDTHGDPDGDGFVEYARHSSTGLIQQGWKDSEDSVFHADGALAAAPIALCEVQGYVYQAKTGAAVMAEAMGEGEKAARLRREAQSLQEKFFEHFWCEDLSFYALALDSAKRPCRVRASNAGHCLYSGIASSGHAAKIAEQLMSDTFQSGWGIRTVGTCEKRYNPMSYHNGSIWPHDNALIAAGLARYGYTRHTSTILEGIFNAALAMDLHRLPELYCGFKKREDLKPILYPLACAPQSWAAASVYLLLQATLGMSSDATRNQIRFTHPVLPSFLEEVQIRNITLGTSTLDLLLKKYRGDVTVSVVRKEGPVEVVIIK